MKKYTRIDYTKVELPEELLTSFAKALAPEIRKFYDSDEGKAYFEKWSQIASASWTRAR